MSTRKRQRFRGKSDPDRAEAAHARALEKTMREIAAYNQGLKEKGPPGAGQGGGRT